MEKKTGRPKAVFPRNHKVLLAFTEKEYAQVQASLEKRKEGTTAEFCRSLIMDALARKRWLRPEELRETKNAFVSVGRNLNQIAKVLNSEGASSLSLRERLNECLLMLYELTKKVSSGDLKN